MKNLSSFLIRKSSSMLKYYRKIMFSNIIVMKDVFLHIFIWSLKEDAYDYIIHKDFHLLYLLNTISVKFTWNTYWIKLFTRQ